MPQVTQNAIRSSDHFGARLCARRESYGLSLSEISELTNIRIDYLAAIEAMDDDALPAIGYTIGYVRSYAKAVGIDDASAVERYKVDSEVPENLGMRDRPHFVPQRKIRLPRGFLPAMTVVAVAGMLTVWYGLQTETQAATLISPDLTQRETEVAAVLADPNMITVKALAPSWVQIKDKKGSVIISRIFVTGETWQTQRGSGAFISARDAGAIQIFVGGGDAGQLGEQGVAIYDIPLAN